MSRRRLKPYIKVLEDLDLQVLDITCTGSCHYKVNVALAGESRFFIVSYSASDRRALLNWRSDVRRWRDQVTAAGNQEAR